MFRKLSRASIRLTSLKSRLHVEQTKFEKLFVIKLYKCITACLRLHVLHRSRVVPRSGLYYSNSHRFAQTNRDGCLYYYSKSAKKRAPDSIAIQFLSIVTYISYMIRHPRNSWLRKSKSRLNLTFFVVCTVYWMFKLRILCLVRSCLLNIIFLKNSAALEY